MVDYPTIIFAALLIFLYGLISRASEKSPITAPMVFAGIGILAGPVAFNLLDIKLNTTFVKLVAEITLVMILFVDASTVNLKTLRIQRGIPIRLLGIGLPLTMLLGFVVAARCAGSAHTFPDGRRPWSSGRDQRTTSGENATGYQRGEWAQ
jgi:NhaP-type Na+/H+ or K+/H+ antiporter